MTSSTRRTGEERKSTGRRPQFEVELAGREVDGLLAIEGHHLRREAVRDGEAVRREVIPVPAEVLLPSGIGHPNSVREILRVMLKLRGATAKTLNTGDAGPKRAVGDVCHASRWQAIRAETSRR